MVILRTVKSLRCFLFEIMIETFNRNVKTNGKKIRFDIVDRVFYFVFGKRILTIKIL